MEPTPQPKPWYTSKTLIANGVILIVFILNAMIEAVGGGGLPPEFAQYSAYILIGLNIALRLVTKTPIDFTVFNDDDDDGGPGDDRGPASLRMYAALLAIPFLSTLDTGHSALFAANPRAMIVGPTAAVPGDKILLDASKSTEAETYRWEVRNRKSDDRTGFTIDESGKVLEIFSYPGIYDVTLAVANGDGIDLARWTVTVYSAIPPGPLPPRPRPPTPEPSPPGPGPSPPDPDGPDPPDPVPVPPRPPEPNLPDGQFSVARPAYEQAGLIVSTQRASQAHKIAVGFEGISAAISAGTLGGVEAIVEQMRNSNRQALGTQLAAWKSFDTWFSGQLKTLFESGRLDSNESWATLLNEVANGLKQVR